MVPLPPPEGSQRHLAGVVHVHQEDSVGVDANARGRPVMDGSGSADRDGAEAGGKQQMQVMLHGDLPWTAAQGGLPRI